MSVSLLYDSFFLEHDTGPHPENASRLVAVSRALEGRGLLPHRDRLQFRPASDDELAAVHHRRYLRFLEELSWRGGGYLTADTVMSAQSAAVARLAAGAAIQGALAVYRGEVEHAFVLSRPPGHHARPGQGMGFCLLNNVAVAARAVQAAGAKRILIVDFDVHHGNGTQEIFYDDPTVLYFSSHQYPAYPGTGAVDELGRDEAMGTTVNIPMPPGVGDEGHLRVYREILPPIARRFRPEVLLVSAGYDAHWTNFAYLSSIRMNVTVAGFAGIVAQLHDLARELCHGHMALLLEGGYDPEALAASVLATIDTLEGRGFEDPVGPPPQAYSEPDLQPLLAEVARLHGL